MKKSLFDKKMRDADFRAIYDEVSAEMNIAEQIAKLRHEAKMSQSELAKKVSTSRTAIARYESGHYGRYNLITLIKIARAFNKRLKISYV